MDALLSALVACLICEVGGANQNLALALAQRFQRDGAVLTGVAFATLANAVLSAIAGWYISKLMSADARTLLLALALVFSGFGMLMAAKQADTLDNWRIGAFATTLLGMFILGFGDASQFIIFGLATRTADPVWAAVGGTLGGIIACVPVVLLRQPLLSVRKLRAVRQVAGGAVLIIGAILGLSAIKIL